MIAIVWEFLVREEALATFRRAYGPDGDWAALFRRHPGYRGTTLLQDRTQRTRFLTVDHWDDAAHFEAMQQASASEYSSLDERFGALTLSERALGEFEAE
jgi:heme-degrading monooxygenase HmoA